MRSLYKIDTYVCVKKQEGIFGNAGFLDSGAVFAAGHTEDALVGARKYPTPAPQVKILKLG